MLALSLGPNLIGAWPGPVFSSKIIARETLQSLSSVGALLVPADSCNHSSPLPIPRFFVSLFSRRMHANRISGNTRSLGRT